MSDCDKISNSNAINYPVETGEGFPANQKYRRTRKGPRPLQQHHPSGAAGCPVFRNSS
jgi:hypothetical protein